jgi:hypothetical protein
MTGCDGRRYPICELDEHLCCAERTGLTIDPAYTNGAAYLKTIGIVNPAEVARVLDIAMSKWLVYCRVRAGLWRA